MKSKQKEKPTGFSTVYPTIPYKACRENFVFSLPKAVDGANSYDVQSFLTVADSIWNSGIKTFGFQDFLNGLKPFDLRPHETREMFDKFVQTLERFHKLEKVQNSCYDDDVYMILCN